MPDRDFVSINPTTEQVIERWPAHDDERVQHDLHRATEVFPAWRDAGPAERATVLRRAAGLLERDRDRYARLATEEMGKPLAEARAEVTKCATALRYFAENGAAFMAERLTPSNATESYVAFRPLGLVLAIMPWNFPYWQVVRFAAPALMAGNVGYLKHSENVSGCALALQDLFSRAGAPQGVFTTGLLRTGRMAALIEEDRRVAAVTLTGSTRAGRSVAASAGKGLKKSVLELGGSDAFIVLADADLDAASTMAVNSRFQNAGQSCIAAKRFIVEAAVADKFTEMFAAKVADLTVGDPTEEGVRVGPMAREDLREALEDQVARSVQAGARVVVGGSRREGRGWFYQPTVLTDVTRAMPVFTEETFGPVAPVFVARDADEAVAMANDSDFGLGGNLWTGDVERGKKLARVLESGGVFINGMTASDPRLPFGGVKDSGYGRELAVYGIHEFVNVQTVWVGPAVDPTEVPAE